MVSTLPLSGKAHHFFSNGGLGRGLGRGLLTCTILVRIIEIIYVGGAGLQEAASDGVVSS
jgi:hypothetical protein